MDNNNMICVSVRMTREEYLALQMMAKQDFTTMSGILRKLLRDAVERGCIHEKQNVYAEPSASNDSRVWLKDE